jgi:peptide deformylase
MTRLQKPITNKIQGKDAKVLRRVAKPVDLKEIGSKKIRDVLKVMKKALHGEEDGVAIAAPQIGESLRIFVVSARAFALTSSKKKVLPDKEFNDLVFVNPEIIKVSKKKKNMEEGCLSVRWLYGEVERHEKITITAFDEKGVKSTFGAGGLMAQIFQHEIDHLNGVLFIDKAENVRDLPPSPKTDGE